MTAATIDQTAVQPARLPRLSIGAGDVDHYDCCDLDTAICGWNIAGWSNVDDEGRPPCPLCSDAVERDLPCTVATCPARRGLVARIRRWWGSR